MQSTPLVCRSATPDGIAHRPINDSRFGSHSPPSHIVGSNRRHQALSPISISAQTLCDNLSSSVSSVRVVPPCGSGSHSSSANQRARSSTGGQPIPIPQGSGGGKDAQGTEFVFLITSDPGNHRSGIEPNTSRSASAVPPHKLSARTDSSSASSDDHCAPSPPPSPPCACSGLPGSLCTRSFYVLVSHIRNISADHLVDEAASAHGRAASCLSSPS